MTNRTERQDQRIRFLRNEVLTHLKEMPTIDELSHGVEIDNKEVWEMYGGEDCDLDINYNISTEEYQDRAVLNLGTFICNTRNNGKSIGKKYNCGREGCFAGWYRILGEDRGFLTEAEQSEVGSYEIRSLANHFGISRSETANLFSSLGKGVEGFPEDAFDSNGDGDTSRDLNKDALQARAAYLNELFVNYEINTGETNE